MRILFVSPRQCWPTTSGAKLREYYFARALGARWEITFLYFGQPGAMPLTTSELPFCRKVVTVPPPQLYTPAKIARGMIGRWPLPVVNYTSPEMMAAIETELRAGKFDLIHIDYVNMASYAPLLRRFSNAPHFYNWHNIESELMLRYAENTASIPRKFYASWTARRLARLERGLLDDAFGHVVCSERERAQLRAIAPEAHVAAVENGVDTAFFADCGGPGRRHRIVFVGAMAYHANVDAAVSFVRSVWPAVRDRYPEWKLTLVGANPAPAVLALRDEKNVEVTGTVDDVRPYYKEAIAAIVPLKTGGGTRLKILEAFAAGVPVVSTALGAEGLDVNAGEHLLIAAQDSDWLQHLSALAPQNETWTRLAEAGKRLARSRYDWEILGNTLCETYARWLSERPAA